MSVHPMIPVPEALKLALTAVASHLIDDARERDTIHNDDKDESVSIHDALNRCSAQTIHAPRSIPQVPTSILDGFCLKFRDLSKVKEKEFLKFKVTGYNLAGRKGVILDIPGSKSISTDENIYNDDSCNEFETRYVATGAAVPNGFDTVVGIEKVDIEGELNSEGDLLSAIDKAAKKQRFVSITLSSLDDISSGQWIRKVGSDLVKGAKLLDAGTNIDPFHIGILAQVGVQNIKVKQLPIVGILSTGDELIGPGDDCADVVESYKVFDANRPMLLSLGKQFGAVMIDLGAAEDNADSVEEKLHDGLIQCDIVVTTGGISMGELDLLEKVVMKTFKGRLHFGRIHMKPGKPTTLFTVKTGNSTKFILSLPGNPVSAAVCSHLFLQPMVSLFRKGCNFHTNVDDVVNNAHVHAEVVATLTQDVKLDKERPEYHRVSLSWNHDRNEFLASSTGMQRSSRLMSMNGATGLMCLPQGLPEKNTSKAGEKWNVLLLNGEAFVRNVRFKDSRHVQGINIGKSNLEPQKVSANLNAFVICHKISSTKEDIIDRVDASMKIISISSSIKTDSNDEALSSIQDCNDVDIIIIVSSNRFRSNIDLSSFVSRHLEKNADALAFQMKQSAASANGLAAMLDFIAGSIKKKLILLIPEMSIEPSLRKIDGKVISHAIMIATRS